MDPVPGQCAGFCRGRILFGFSLVPSTGYCNKATNELGAECYVVSLSRIYPPLPKDGLQPVSSHWIGAIFIAANNRTRPKPDSQGFCNCGLKPPFFRRGQLSFLRNNLTLIGVLCSQYFEKRAIAPCKTKNEHFQYLFEPWDCSRTKRALQNPRHRRVQ
jgi:hypothetical protein